MRRWGSFAAVMFVLACGDATGDVSFRGGDAGPSVLLFSRTTGFRHGSIEPAIATLQAEGGSRGWSVTASEDPTLFTTESLADFDVVVFLLTTGDVLDEAQQGAFEEFIGAGRGYAGVHSATDTEYDWPWYGELLGGYFDGHPAPQDATVDVVDAGHPSTEHLSPQWMRFDEWYNFSPDPSATVDVLLNLDESTYDGGSMGASHPIAWTHEHAGGRAWYTAGGHADASYDEPEFVAHLVAGVEWAAGGADPGSTTGSETTTGGGADSTTGSPPGGSSGAPEDDEDDGASGNGSASTGASASGGGTVDPGDSTGASEESADADEGSGCSCRHGGPAPWALWALLLFARRIRLLADQVPGGSGSERDQ